MKKLLISSFAVAFVLGFTGTAFATKNYNSAKSNTSSISEKECKAPNVWDAKNKKCVPPKKQK